MSDPIQTVEQKDTVQGKTVLSFSKPSPMWATWVFRIVFILTGVAAFVVLSDSEIPAPLAKRIALYLKGIDMLVWGITKSIGVDVSRDYNVPQT